MSLYRKLDNDAEFIDFFCDLLEITLSAKYGRDVNIGFKKNDESIFFFIDGKAILQMNPDGDSSYTYSSSSSDHKEVEDVIRTAEKQYNRDKRIDEIIKK